MFDVQSILTTGGLLILFLIIFSESGMMVGLFFPGDTLLFSAGILAAGGSFNIVTVIAVIAGAAILGDNIGYLIGKHVGPKLFKEDGLIFRHEYIMRAESFFDKYGNKTMLIAHFIPIVRSFAPVAAGAGSMDRRQFIVYDAIGDIAWAVIVTLTGYYIGSRIPGIEHYIEPVLLGIVVIFLVPTLYHAFKDPKLRTMLRSKFSKKPKSKD